MINYSNRNITIKNFSAFESFIKSNLKKIDLLLVGNDWFEALLGEPKTNGINSYDIPGKVTRSGKDVSIKYEYHYNKIRETYIF